MKPDPKNFASDFRLVATGYHFPTCLQILWTPIWGPWRGPLSAISRN